MVISPLLRPEHSMNANTQHSRRLWSMPFLCQPVGGLSFSALCVPVYVALRFEAHKAVLPKIYLLARTHARTHARSGGGAHPPSSPFPWPGGAPLRRCFPQCHRRSLSLVGYRLKWFWRVTRGRATMGALEWQMDIAL